LGEWIKRVNDPVSNETDRERKAYALAEGGKQVLNAEIQRLEKLVMVARNQTAEEGTA
jgi:DNA-binding PadR family transcriptional regulator